MKRTFFYWVLLIFCIFSLVEKSFAQGPPIFSDSPILLGLEGRGIRTFGRYIVKENASIYVHPFAVPYNIIAKLAIGGIAPFVQKNPDNLKSQSGLGDISVFAKYVIVQEDRTAKTFRIVVKVQETFPTGKTNSEPPIGQDAYQSYLGIVSGYITTEYSLYSELGYNAVSNNLSDNLVYSFTFGYPLLPVTYPSKQVNLYMGFNGNSSFETNQTTILTSPGIQYIAGRRFLLEGGIQFPVVQNLPEESKTKVIYTLGVRVLIF